MIVGMWVGDPQRVWHGSDSWGYTCGVINRLSDGSILDLTDRPYIMHYDISDITGTELCVRKYERPSDHGTRGALVGGQAHQRKPYAGMVYVLVGCLNLFSVNTVVAKLSDM